MPAEPPWAGEDLTELLAGQGIRFGLLKPTATGLKKSIIDANQAFRRFLVQAGIHDFDVQPQGVDHKREVAAWFVYADRVERSVATLYRPRAKAGDPRIWFKGLPAYCDPGDTLLILETDGEFFIANVSNEELQHSAVDHGTPLQRLIAGRGEGETLPVINGFLSELLTLQQDGAGAISAPSSWNTPPVLEVAGTPTYTAADEMVQALGSDSSDPRWHFFVGSPGNGKSAATGRLVRSLVDMGWSALDTEGANVLDAASGKLPVAIRMFAPGASVESLFIVQDASVVSDPFTAEPDPGKDLLAVLGIARAAMAAVWVCVNRGILELAVRECDDAWLSSVLRMLVESETGGTQAVVTEDGGAVELSWNVLDNYSLILSECQELRSLVENATLGDRWSICTECPARNLCPFLANRQLLVSGPGRERFIELVGEAELFGMQPVVFREAQALISVVLAGVPDDYRNQVPCQWVQERAGARDVFTLGSRRLPMLLFGAREPAGFPVDLYKEVLHALSGIGAPGSAPPAALPAEGLPPSSETGVPRLIGHDGLIRQLDALLAPLDTRLDEWETAFPEIELPGLIGDLERLMMGMWSFLDEQIGSGRPEPRLQQFLHRWRSAFTVRYGAFATGAYRFKPELTTFRQAVGLADALSNEIRDNIANSVKTILKEGSEGIYVTLAAELSADWVEEKLRPRLSPTLEGSMPRLRVSFGKNQSSMQISTEAFCWLEYRRRTGLALSTMPPDVAEAGRQALRRAAAQGRYSRDESVEQPRVSLVIRRPDETVTTLTRYGPFTVECN